MTFDGGARKRAPFFWQREGRGHHGNRDWRLVARYPAQKIETFEKCSILFKVKKDDNFNHMNALRIYRIRIGVFRDFYGALRP
jgi:hypothetical protein